MALIEFEHMSIKAPIWTLLCFALLHFWATIYGVLYYVSPDSNIPAMCMRLAATYFGITATLGFVLGVGKKLTVPYTLGKSARPPWP